MPRRVPAALPGRNRVQAEVLVRVEQGREQAEVLLDLEPAREGAEPALGEVDHSLVQQNSRSSRCATVSLLGIPYLGRT